eukprot:GHVR01047051.1.p1 GENE.GHVR01047051.1~~GHVR01047051.1.p1  ORF type:complete len:186 (+),score=87.24 GHVR01047051.1:600-1157(+)
MMWSKSVLSQTHTNTNTHTRTHTHRHAVAPSEELEGNVDISWLVCDDIYDPYRFDVTNAIHRNKHIKYTLTEHTQDTHTHTQDTYAHTQDTHTQDTQNTFFNEIKKKYSEKKNKNKNENQSNNNNSVSLELDGPCGIKMEVPLMFGLSMNIRMSHDIEEWKPVLLQGEAALIPSSINKSKKRKTR